MAGKLRGKLTYANVMATVAVFIALGGASYAATHLSKNSVGTRQIKKNAVTSPKIRNGAVTQRKISTSAQAALKTIPNGSVTAADLSPELKASLTLRCPSGMRRAADLCFDANLRNSAQYDKALKACASAGLRLPSDAELVLAFEHLGAPQTYEWVSTQYTDVRDPGSGPVFLASYVSEDASRQLSFGYAGLPGSSIPFRCVTTATN